MTAFRKNPRLDAELAKSADVHAKVVAGAQAMARHAAVIARADAQAPWMPSGGRTIVVQADANEVRVVNTDYGGHLQEFGSKNNPPYAPLRRGARAAGLHLKENGK